jgi:uncharacterized membrane protein YadS
MFIRKMRRRDDPDVQATRGIDTFPLWLGVFIFAWILACLHLFKEPAHTAVFNMVQWDFSLAAAALGLSLSIKDIAGAGFRGFILTIATGILRIVLLLAAITVCIQTGLLQL